MQRESDVCESVCEADVLVHGCRRCRASYLCETGRAGAQERARTSTAAVASLHPTTPSGPGTMSKAKKIKAPEEDPETKKHLVHRGGFRSLRLFSRGP